MHAAGRRCPGRPAANAHVSNAQATGPGAARLPSIRCARLRDHLTRMTRVSHRVTWADNSWRFIANDRIRWPTAIIDQRKDCRCSKYCTGPSPPWLYFSARPPHHPSHWPIAGAVRLKNVWLPVKRPAVRTAAFIATRRSGTRRYQRSASSQRSADISGTRPEGLEVQQ